MARRWLSRPSVAIVVTLATLVAACGPAAMGSPGPSASPRPSASPGDVVLTIADLKLRLVVALGPLWYCDPDEYPVARDDEAARATERLPEIRADAESWAAITAALGLDAGAGSFTPDEQLAIYREWKVLAAIELVPSGSGFAFDELFGPTDATGQLGEHVTGTIARDASIEVDERSVSGQPMCPICLARGTAILTPAGSTAVEDLRAGMAVWTLDGAGRKVRGTVLAVASTPVPATHQVVRLVLSDGRTVSASPGHPLADGRPLGVLRPGDLVDGATVTSVDIVAYGGRRTFDLVVSGATGAYLAGDGIPLASTIER
jgi:hypothetical protein